MKLNAPKKIVFIIACILAVVGLLAGIGFIPAVAAYSAWIAFVGFALLAAGNVLKGF